MSQEVSLETLQNELNEELAALRPAGSKTPLMCRWGFHDSVELDPSDTEHEELCKLLGRSRSTCSIPKDIKDKICVRCGNLDPGLQRFLITLRKLRQ